MRSGREGSRWFNTRPNSEEFTTWCRNNIPVHDGLDINRYIPGVMLISQSEKEVVREDNKKRDVWHTVYSPHPKVETRVLYWNDWIAQQEGVLGLIEPVPPARPDPYLPEGFFIATLAGAEFVCCTMRARALKNARRETVVNRRTGESEDRLVGDEILRGTPATKQVAVKMGGNPDENALMKAETGAIGRTLGLAGMLVVPGAGIASYEDIQELNAPQATQPTLIASTEEQTAELEKREKVLLGRLGPNLEQEHKRWMEERGIGSDPDFGQLKASVRKLEQLLA